MKLTYIVSLFVTLFAMSALAGKDDLSTVTISNGSNVVLTAANFSRIRDFIIKGGKRQTYCNMFNNNPFWGFSAFNAYLNPPNQGNIDCEIAKSDFPILVIQTRKPITYWHVRLDDSSGQIQITQHYRKVDSRSLTEEVSKHFLLALKEIEENSRKSNQSSEATR